MEAQLRGKATLDSGRSRRAAVGRLQPVTLPHSGRTREGSGIGDRMRQQRARAVQSIMAWRATLGRELAVEPGGSL